MKIRTIKSLILTLCLMFGINASGAWAGEGEFPTTQASGIAAENVSLVSEVAGYIVSATVKNNDAYVSDWSAHKMRVIDVSDIDNPAQSGSCASEGSAPQEIAVQGDYAYIADEDGLTITTSEAGNPTRVGYQYLDMDTYGVAVSDDYAYLANTFGMFTADISNPITPTLVSPIPTFYTTGYAMDLEINGNTAYVIDDDAVFYIIDVSNPITNTLIGKYDLPGEAYGLAISGNYAYIGNYYQGLSIINFSNPMTPTLESATNTPGIAHGVAVSGNYAYVADSDNGLIVYNISFPIHPVQVGYYDTPGSAWDVTVAGDYIFVSDKNAGLKILRFTPEYDYYGFLPLGIKP